MSSDSLKTKQDELRSKILQSTSLPRLKTSNTSLAALEKLKADLEAKRQTGKASGTPPVSPANHKLSSSEGSLLSSSDAVRRKGDVSPREMSAVPEPQEAGKDQKDKKEKEAAIEVKLSTPPLLTISPPPIVPRRPRGTEVTVADLGSEFEDMMVDLKFTDVQRAQMDSLPESHKQTILLQWKKKKAALAERRASVSSPPGSPVVDRTNRPAVPSGLSVSNRSSTPPPVPTGPKPAPTIFATPPPVGDSSEALLATLEARKQQKMEALKKLRAELALKRQLAQKGIQKEQLSPEALQSIMHDLQEQRRVRRETREQKLMIKEMSAVEKMTKEGKISSMADMQAAIQQASEMRKLRAERALERKQRRSTKKLILKGLEGSGIEISRRGSRAPTVEEAELVQETKKLRRLTRHLDLEAKEVKIDSQLTNFLSSMVKLEEEWKKQEQFRIQRQVEYEMLQKEHTDAQERLKRSEELISDTKTRLSSIAAALAAAAGRHQEDSPLQGCQKELSYLLEHLGMEAISVVDHRTAEQIEEEKKVAIQKRTEELEKEAEESEGSLGGLLAQLKGAKLKKVDQEEVEKQKLAAPPPPALGESLGMFTSLQDTLRGALEMRKLAIMDSDSDDDDDDDDDDFWDDEDDDFDDLDDLNDLMSTTVRI